MSETLPFWEALAAHAASTALVDASSGDAITYETLYEKAAVWAERLRSLVDDRAVVALEAESSFEGIAAYLGVLQAGFPLLIGEPGTFGADTAVVRTYRPAILIARDAGGVTAQRMGADVPETAGWHPDMWILLSTSGSTGDPKLVRLSRGNIRLNAAWAAIR